MSCSRTGNKLVINKAISGRDIFLFKIEKWLGKTIFLNLSGIVQSYQHNLLFLLYPVSKVWRYKIFIENFMSRANKECHKTLGVCITRFLLVLDLKVLHFNIFEEFSQRAYPGSGMERGGRWEAKQKSIRVIGYIKTQGGKSKDRQ